MAGGGGTIRCQAGHSGEVQSGQGNKTDWILADFPYILISRLESSMMTYEHSIFAGFTDHLDYQLVEIIQCVFKVFRVSTFGSIGSSARLVTGRVRHIGIDAFIIGYSGSGRIGYCNIAQTKKHATDRELLIGCPA